MDVSQAESDSTRKSILRRWHAMKISRVSAAKLAVAERDALNEIGVSDTKTGSLWHKSKSSVCERTRVAAT